MGRKGGNLRITDSCTRGSASGNWQLRGRPACPASPSRPTTLPSSPLRSTSSTTLRSLAGLVSLELGQSVHRTASLSNRFQPLHGDRSVSGLFQATHAHL